MGRGIDNYYLILELNFTKPESDSEVIKKRIAEKRKFWNAHSDKGSKQEKYRQYKADLLNITTVMGDEAKRNAEAEEAKLFVNNILKEELKYISGRKDIDKQAAENIMAKCGLWPEMFTELTKLNIITDETKSTDPIADPNPKPDKTVKFKTYDKYLGVLQKKNLYNFLADGKIEVATALETSDGKELIEKYSNTLKKKVEYDMDEEANSIRSLCAACEEVFNPSAQELRKNYDKYLIWKKKDEVITRMVKYSGTNREITEEQKELYVVDLARILGKKEEAEKIFFQICAFKGLRFIGNINQQASKKEMIECGYCFKSVDISKGEKNCPHCGSALYMNCPKCEKSIPASSNACSYCGFKLDNIYQVEKLCHAAQAFLENMDFAMSKSSLKKAEELLPKYEKIDTLKKKLSEQEKIFSTEIGKLNTLVAEKSFYKALELLRNLQQKVPTAKIPNDALIENSVKKAEELYKVAVSIKQEDDLLKTCSEIMGICKDYPGLDSLLVKYPPEPPKNIKITTDGISRTNTLTWEKSPSEGNISYKIIRRADTAAVGIDDPEAEEIGTASITRFVDTKLIPGIIYYYSVYTIRVGIASKPSYERAVNLGEVEIVRKEEGNEFIKVEWKTLEKNVKIDVFRGENYMPAGAEDGKRVATGKNFFLDERLKNDKEYYYLIIVTYRIDAKNISVTTKLGPLIPTSIPEPVDDLRINHIEEGIFEASWSDYGTGKVRLYRTDKKISLKFGDITTIDIVEEQLELVDVITEFPRSCRFQIRDNKKYAVIPVTVKHNTAVIGEQALAAKIEKIHITSTKHINSDLKISIKWPEDAVSIFVIYGTDAYAKSLEDRKGKQVKNIPKALYDADTGLFIRNIEKKDYYITLYSVCRINGEDIYSGGTQLLFGNSEKMDIQYLIKRRGFFNKQIELEFSSKTEKFYLPAIDIVLKNGGIPLYTTSGTVIEHIEGQEVNGNFKIQIAPDRIAKNSYLKPFFSDIDINDKINLRPIYGTNFKIS